MSNFQNLLSLIIESNRICEFELPDSIWKLRQLRHLIVSRGFLAAPDTTSPLENLQTLKEVILSWRNVAYLFQRVPNLIKLGFILYPLEDQHLNESLVCLRQLEELKIRFKYNHPKHFCPIFPCQLKKFTLERCRASVSFLGTLGSLPNLEVLKLMSCIFDDATWEVREGEFPKLKMLQLYSLDEITAFIVEDSSTAFPMLNRLLINSCYDLVELSDEIGDIPTLELIQVSYCGKGVRNWASRVEEDQQSYGNDTLQVRWR